MTLGGGLVLLFDDFDKPCNAIPSANDKEIKFSSLRAFRILNPSKHELACSILDSFVCVFFLMKPEVNFHSVGIISDNYEGISTPMPVFGECTPLTVSANQVDMSFSHSKKDLNIDLN